MSETASPPGLRLRAAELEILAGSGGPGAQLAAELIVALGKIYGARDLVSVAGAQVAGVSYRNLGEAGLEFLRSWACKGAAVRIPTTLNPAGMDLLSWREHGIPSEFALPQLAVIEAYTSLGVTPSCTCTPYLAGNCPRFGEHVAWSESSAVAFANSVLGARTNREGGPGALAAAVLGRAARYGLHLDGERCATVVVDVTCRLATPADFGALGYLVGRLAGDGVPYLQLRRCPPGLQGHDHLLESPYLPHLKSLGAAMAASGAVGLYHIEGVTPEARRRDLVPAGVAQVVLDDLQPGYEALNRAGPDVDLVSIGCPHASLAEIARVAEVLRGRRVQAGLWITTARATLEQARRQGLWEPLAVCGARLMADTCLVVAPMAAFDYRSLATNSAKMAVYAPGHCGLATHFGSLETCIEAAVSGRWTAASGQ